jgi:hypothetical protein
MAQAQGLDLPYLHVEVNGVSLAHGPTLTSSSKVDSAARTRVGNSIVTSPSSPRSTSEARVHAADIIAILNANCVLFPSRAISVEEPVPKLFFQFGERLACRRLGKPNAARSPRNAAFLADSSEDLQLPKRDLHGPVLVRFLRTRLWPCLGWMGDDATSCPCLVSGARALDWSFNCLASAVHTTRQKFSGKSRYSALPINRRYSPVSMA